MDLVKTLISTVLWLLHDLLPLMTVVNLPTISTGNKQKNRKKLTFYWYLKSHREKELYPDPGLDT